VPSTSLKQMRFRVVAFLSSMGLSSMILFVESGSVSTMASCHNALSAQPRLSKYCQLPQQQVCCRLYLYQACKGTICRARLGC
jgi:hypothetical protein